MHVLYYHAIQYLFAINITQCNTKHNLAIEWQPSRLPEEPITLYVENYTLCLKKTVHFCFCQNCVKFPLTLISFGR